MLFLVLESKPCGCPALISAGTQATSWGAASGSLPALNTVGAPHDPATRSQHPQRLQRKRRLQGGDKARSRSCCQPRFPEGADPSALNSHHHGSALSTATETRTATAAGMQQEQPSPQEHHSLPCASHSPAAPSCPGQAHPPLGRFSLSREAQRLQNAAAVKPS